MTEPPVVDLWTARRRQHVGRNQAFAEFALTQCEQALFSRDWDRFDFWFRAYKGVRDCAPGNKRKLDYSVSPRQIAAGRSRSAGGKQPNRFTRAMEVSMHYGRIALTLLLVVFATPVPAQTVTHSTSKEATIVAATTLPEVTAVPLYIRVIGGSLWSDEVNGVSTAIGFFYQVSGATVVSVDGKATPVSAGSGIFIPAGARVTFKAVTEEPSIYLQFLLSPIAFPELPDISPIGARELYRSSSPIPGLREGSYVLSLIRATLPHQAPPDVLHHRSGAALHFVLSGFGAESAKGVTVAKGPGSVSYEPAELSYQWSNPGNLPLTYLVFNLNPESENAVLASVATDNQRQ